MFAWAPPATVAKEDGIGIELDGTVDVVKAGGDNHSSIIKSGGQNISGLSGLVQCSFQRFNGT